MEEQLIPAQEFCAHHHVEMSLIYSLQEYGLVDVIKNEDSEYLSVEQLSELEKILRLHYDLHVNMAGVDVILHLLKQLESAQHELDALRNQLKFYR